jgi:hypothetical protein
MIKSEDFKIQYPYLYQGYSLVLRKNWSAVLKQLLRSTNDKKIRSEILNQLSNNNRDQVMIVLETLKRQGLIRGALTLPRFTSLSQNTGVEILVIPSTKHEFIAIRMPHVYNGPNNVPADLNIEDFMGINLSVTVEALIRKKMNFAKIAETETEEQCLKSMELDIKGLEAAYKDCFESGSALIAKLETTNIGTVIRTSATEITAYAKKKQEAMRQDHYLYAKAFDRSSKQAAYNGLANLYSIHQRILELKQRDIQRTLSSPACTNAAKLESKIPMNSNLAQRDSLESSLRVLINKHFNTQNLQRKSEYIKTSLITTERLKKEYQKLTT